MKPPWLIIGASVAGSAHAKTGTPCQDAYAYRRLPDDVMALAVADGAGSAERSDEGAQTAVAACLEAIAESLALGWPTALADWQVTFDNAFKQARRAVVVRAGSAGSPRRELASTLLCAVASEHGLGVAQLGDGLVVACQPVAGPSGVEAGPWFVAAPPQRGEYANETFFLTQGEALLPVDVRHYPEAVLAVAVMTDGLLRLVLNLPRNEPHRAFFQPLLAFALQVDDEAQAQAHLAAFLNSTRVTDRTDDDKTLLLAVRPGAA